MSDEYYQPVEYRVYYAYCTDKSCGWEEGEYHDHSENCPRKCPECGADTDVAEDWDNR